MAIGLLGQPSKSIFSSNGRAVRQFFGRAKDRPANPNSSTEGSMRMIVSRVCAYALVAATAAATVTSAAAQTTVILNQAKPDVVYATLRAGTYANTNYQTVLTTRGADTNTTSSHRQALLKFDTEHRIPFGANVTSASVTLTVKSGSAVDTTRTIGAYQVTTSWDETEATWNHRRTSSAWMSAGGDLGTLLAKQVVSNVTGTKVTYDVTSLVQAAVAGKLGTSRYTRIALVDVDTETTDSTRNFYTPDEANSALRPTLKVVYGASSAPTVSSSNSTTLRVLQWNSQHGGYGTDGVLDPARFIKKAASFKPDLFSINEVERYDSYANYDAPVKLAALMNQYTGQTWYWKFATNAGGADGRGNMILSRFPFTATGSRPLGHNGVGLDVAVNVNGRTVNFTSTHLYYNSTDWRLDQIGELLSWETGLAEQRIIVGDFNTQPGTTESLKMTATYVDSWAKAQSDGTAIAYPDNPTGKTRNTRLDYIYYSKGATALKLISSQVFDVRDSNGVMPSDHRPVLSVFSVK
jgi:endonuclease/exonuclease/phosphatase family metal-dependent hydrolase